MENEASDSTITKFPHGSRVYVRTHKGGKVGVVTAGPTYDGIYLIHWADEPHPTCFHECDLISEEQAVSAARS
jgi:hypothetical protein